MCHTVTRQHCHPILDSYGSSYSSSSTVFTTAGRMTAQQGEDDNPWASPLTHHQHFIHLTNITCPKKKPPKDMHMDDGHLHWYSRSRLFDCIQVLRHQGFFANSTSCRTDPRTTIQVSDSLKFVQY